MDYSQERERIKAEILKAGSTEEPFAAAMRASLVPMLITNPRRFDNPIVFVNDAFTALTGLDREETMGRNCRFLQSSETDRATVSRIRNAIENRQEIVADILNRKRSGETFWNRLIISPVFDREGSLIYFFACQQDVSAEKIKATILSQ